MTNATEPPAERDSVVRILSVLGGTTGLLALVPTFSQVLGIDSRYADLLIFWGALAIGVYVISRFLVLSKQLIPWWISAALLVALLWVRFGPGHEPWARWQRTVDQAVDACPANADPCIANVVASVVGTHPALKAPSTEGAVTAMTELMRDARIGHALTQNETVRRSLRRWFGIGDSFTGVGFSIARGEPHYSRALIPEYVIPNYKEGSAGACILTWRIEPKTQHLRSTLAEILGGQTSLQPSASNAGCSLADVFPYLYDTQLPAVVRFQQLTKAQHEGSGSPCLGRREAHRVFASSLSALYTRRFADAAELSGYILDTTMSNATLFMWVFVPSSSDEVARATWSEVLPKVAAWVGRNECTE